MKHIFTLFICLLAIHGTANARRVSGEVISEGKGLSKVIVTDGKSFTQTTAGGKFTFNIEDDAEFVYIITPSGHVADWSKGSPEFYRKAADTDFFSFDLQKMDGAEKEYNIIAVGDPQPRKTRHYEEFIGRPLDDITRTADALSSPTIGIVLGDICYDNLPLMTRWKEDIVRTGIPFYPSVGNHDHDRAFNDDKKSIHAYRSNFGPENYAFFIGKDLVIVLDNIIYHSRSGYDEGYTEEIVDWVRGLMKFVPKNADIFIAQHSPMNGRCYRTKDYDINTVNCEKLLEVIGNHQITVLSGHNHMNGIFQYRDNVMEHNVAAICGTWWDAYHCTDGTPRGYKVLTKNGKDLTWYYKAIDKDPDFQYEIFMPGTTKLHPEHLVVNIWDYDQKWKVEYFEDGKPMGAMTMVSEYSPIHTEEIETKHHGKEISTHKLTHLADHYFAAKPSADAKEIIVVITNRFGKVWKETIQLQAN